MSPRLENNEACKQGWWDWARPWHPLMPPSPPPSNWTVHNAVLLTSAFHFNCETLQKQLGLLQDLWKCLHYRGGALEQMWKRSLNCHICSSRLSRCDHIKMWSLSYSDLEPFAHTVCGLISTEKHLLSCLFWVKGHPALKNFKLSLAWLNVWVWVPQVLAAQQSAQFNRHQEGSAVVEERLLWERSLNSYIFLLIVKFGEFSCSLEESNEERSSSNIIIKIEKKHDKNNWVFRPYARPVCLELVFWGSVPTKVLNQKKKKQPLRSLVCHGENILLLFLWRATACS